jgi:hypothetical protein
MAQVRLWRVHGLGWVAHVLRGVEGLEGKPIQEVSGMQEPSHWPDLPSSLALQYLGQVFQLGNLHNIASEDTRDLAAVYDRQTTLYR